jgi:hypothetical protein
MNATGRSRSRNDCVRKCVEMMALVDVAYGGHDRVDLVKLPMGG